MPFPINTIHRLALEDGTSLLLLEDNASKVILDEAIALDDPLNAATVTTLTPGLTFVGENIAGNNLTYEVQVDTVNTFDSTNPTIGSAAIDRASLNNIGGATFLLANGVAVASGTIIAISFFFQGNATGVKVGTFSGSGTTWTSRAFTTIGTVVAGSLQTFTGLSIAVVAGDILGITGSSGNIEADATSNVFALAGDQFGTGAQIYASSGSGANTYSFGTVSSNVGALLDKTSDLNTGFTDDATLNADDKLLLETGNSGGSLLLEDNSSHLILNYSYPQSDYMTYTVPSSTLSNSTTYYWRARQKIQNGGSYPVTWSEIRSFTISLSVGGAALSSTLLMMNVG